MAATVETATIAIDAELEKQLAALEGCNPEQYHEQALTLAKLCILLPRSSQQEADSLASKLHLVVPFLYSSDANVQANACALLTAVASQSEALAADVCKQAGNAFLDLLRNSNSSSNSSSSQSTEGSNLLLNLYSAVGQLARDNAALRESLLQEETLCVVLSAVESSTDAKVQESLADLMCALASDEQQREKFISAGAVAAAAKLLQASELEVVVRSLMCLGMLLPSSPVAQQQLLQSEGAVATLLQLMRQSGDMDCRIIARDLVGVLTQEPEMKAQVEAVVRQQLSAAN